GVLVSRPGELVSREELRRALWPDDTFVDFDTGLNVVINRIRQALDDSASTPRFIETFARRGYRFIAPITPITPPITPPTRETADASSGLTAATPLSPPSQPDAAIARPRAPIRPSIRRAVT